MKKTNVSCHEAIVLLFLILMSFHSCQSNTSREQEGASEQKTETPTPGPAPKPAQELIDDARQLPGAIDYEGDFLQGASWPGPNPGSMYYALASKYEQGEFFTPGWVSRLNMYLFELSEDQVSSRRSFQAEAPNNYSEANLRKSRSKIIELPSTGAAYSIVYSICPDGEDPCSIYSSVIGDKGKYDFQVMDNVDKSVYLEAQEKMMAGIPKDVQEHMLKQLFD